jgi:hypothetical protein
LVGVVQLTEIDAVVAGTDTQRPALVAARAVAVQVQCVSDLAIEQEGTST